MTKKKEKRKEKIKRKTEAEEEKEEEHRQAFNVERARVEENKKGRGKRGPRLCK